MSKISSFAEKMGLIKEVEVKTPTFSHGAQESSGGDYSESTRSETSPQDERRELNSLTDKGQLVDEVRKVIEDVYSIDGSPNVFKIQEILEGLPKELTTDSKRTTVIKILQSFNLDPGDLFEDGLEKLRMLRTAEDDEQHVAESAIEEANRKAEELRMELSVQEKAIANNEAYQIAVTTEFMEEVKRINRLIEFIDPERYGTLMREESE